MTEEKTRTRNVVGGSQYSVEHKPKRKKRSLGASLAVPR